MPSDADFNNLLKQRDMNQVEWPHRSFLSLNFLVQQVIEKNQSPTDWQFWQLLFSGRQCRICYSPYQVKTEQRHMHCQSHSSDLAPGSQFPLPALFYSFPVYVSEVLFKFWAIVKLLCPELEAGLELIFSEYYYSTFTVEFPALRTNRASWMWSCSNNKQIFSLCLAKGSGY